MPSLRLVGDLVAVLFGEGLGVEGCVVDAVFVDPVGIFVGCFDDGCRGDGDDGLAVGTLPDIACG